LKQIFYQNSLHIREGHVIKAVSKLRLSRAAASKLS